MTRRKTLLFSSTLLVGAAIAIVPIVGETSEPVDRGLVIVSVVDSATSIPLADVEVTLARLPFGREHVDDSSMQKVIAQAVTDGSGLARMSADATVEVLARVEAPYFAEPVFTTPDRDAQQLVTLRADVGAWFGGRVETSDRKPKADAFVRVREQRTETPNRTSEFAGEQTGADGRFVAGPFRIVANATYAVTAHASGYATTTREGIAPVAGAVTDVGTIVIVPERAGDIVITGRVVGATFDVAGKKLELNGMPSGGSSLFVHHGGGVISVGRSMDTVELQQDGAFEFHTRSTGDYRIELDGCCLDGGGVLEFSVPAESKRYDCGVVTASLPATHYSGRVICADGVPVTSGGVRFGDFESQIGPDGTFDLVSCSPGPLPLIVWCERGEEAMPNHVFPSTSGNELRVQPRGILVRITRANAPASIDRPVIVVVKGERLLDWTTQKLSMPAEWRLSEAVGFGGDDAPAPAPAGKASITLTIEGKTPVTKEVMLGAGGLGCDEVVVTFDYAELGLE